MEAQSLPSSQPVSLFDINFQDFCVLSAGAHEVEARLRGWDLSVGGWIVGGYMGDARG